MFTKKCSKCGVLRDISLFSQNRKTKDQLHCSCKICDKEKYLKNREKNILTMREYKKNNSQKIKKYYQDNQEKFQKYRDSKKDETKKYMKGYYRDNLEKRKEYLNQNRDTIKVKRNILEKRKRKEDTIHRIKTYVRNRIRFYLTKSNFTKRNQTFKIVGCSPIELKEYLERNFTHGMSWNNQGDWHIDHIKPLASAKTEEELYILCHFTNLQPMWAADNIKKGSKII
jgi:hypothetical protein